MSLFFYILFIPNQRATDSHLNSQHSRDRKGKVANIIVPLSSGFTVANVLIDNVADIFLF